jgi:ATP-binding cassette subfamily B protein
MSDPEVMGKAYDRRLMRRLLQAAKPYKTWLFISVVLLLGTQAVGAYRPKIVQRAVDEAIQPHEPDKLVGFVWLFVGMLCIEFLLQYGVIYLTQLTGQRIIFDIRMNLYRHLEHLHLQFFDRNPVGRLITRVTSDVESLNDMFTSGLVYVFGDVFLLAGIIVFMALMDVPLTLVTLAVVPVIFTMSMIFKKYVRITYRDVRTRIASINSYLQENLTGAVTVQLFNRERKNFQQFDELNTSLTDAHLRSIFHYAWFYPAINLASSVAIGLIVWYGGGEVVRDSITLGTLIAFVQYAQMFFRPIQDLSDKYNILQTAMASSERIFGLMDLKDDIPNAPDAIFLKHPRGRIEFHNVYFSYSPDKVKSDQDYILKDITLHIDAGQSVALVGSTGSGKTTMINLLSRFYDIQRGRILLDGYDVRKLDKYSLRQSMAVVLQDVFLFSGTILDNIRLGRDDISEADVQEAARQTGADSFIRRLPLGYHEPMQERGSTLSTGQRQLISLARAFVFNPSILILDEATSNIDSESEYLIRLAIEKLMTGRTSLIIAHRLSTIRHVDQIVVMHKGTIRERGTHETLLAQRGLYWKLYQLQYQDQENGLIRSGTNG